MNYKYPIYRPHFNGEERKFIIDCIDSTWISSKGRYIGEFERGFANFLGVKHAISVSNGTVALHVALEALGIGPGDEVIVPTLTYIASANAVRYTGATVVFADSEASYWQIDPDDAERRITENTKAIMPVHLYGHACEMDRILRLAERHNLKVIEDCAEALGTEYGGQRVGTFGDIATFSFFGNKTITTGEGGMVVTNDDAIAKMVTRLRGQGLAEDREYWHDIVGYNYRMTNICAAIGCAQMLSVNEILKKKLQISEWYRAGLSGLPISVQEVRPHTAHSFWMVSILTDNAADRDPLRGYLKINGVETRPLFPPVHRMPMYEGGSSCFPVAESLSARGINLPSYPDLNENDVDSISGLVRAYFCKN